MNYLEFFKQVVVLCQLNSLCDQPKQVTGGLMHKMFRVDTKQQSYAIKLLNPTIMKRVNAIDNYNQADELEEKIYRNGIPVISSLVINNKKRHVLKGQYFYIYPWYEGKSLTSQQITEEHCIKIGKVLAKIHQIERRISTHRHPPLVIQWDTYLNVAKIQNKLIYDLLKENVELLDKIQMAANLSFEKVGHDETICHNDMDSKNVLWKDNEFKIIDCECCGYGNPYLELLEVALCWSGVEHNQISFNLFESVISSYFQNSSLPNLDCEAILYSNVGRLEWLEYNLKRAFNLEDCNVEEQQIGMDQVEKTIKQIYTIDQNSKSIIAILKKYVAH